MSGNLWANEFHIVRVELKGPQNKKQFRKFNEALRQLVESSGGSVRFKPKERSTPEARPRKRSRPAPAKRSKRSRRRS